MRLKAKLETLWPLTARLPPASAYIFAVIADKGFSLLTIPLMAHRLSPASFGELDVAVSVVEFIGLLMTLGLAETCIRFSHAAPGPNPVTPASISGAAIVLAISLGAAVQLFLNGIISAIGIVADPAALRVAAAGVCATGLIEMPLVWLRLKGHPWRYFAFVGTRAAVQAFATVTVLLAGWGTPGLLMSNGVLLLAFAAVLSAAQYRRTGIEFSFAPFPLVARYGIPLVGGLLAMFALGNCDRWFLSGRVPPQEIAYYGLAVKLALVTAVAYQPFLLWWSARRLSILWEQGPEKLAKIWGHGAGLLLLSAMFVSLAAPAFIYGVFPESYRPAGSYLPLLVLISVLNELCSLSNTGAYATSHGFKVLSVNAAGAIVAISGYAALIPSQGAMGAIEATIGAHLLRLALFLAIGHHAAPVPYPWKAFALAAVLAAASVLFAPPAYYFIARGAWLLVSECLLAAALFALNIIEVPAPLLAQLDRMRSRPAA